MTQGMSFTRAALAACCALPVLALAAAPADAQRAGLERAEGGFEQSNRFSRNNAERVPRPAPTRVSIDVMAEAQDREARREARRDRREARQERRANRQEGNRAARRAAQQETRRETRREARNERGNNRAEARQQRRQQEARQDRRQDRREARQERRQQEARQERRADRREARREQERWERRQDRRADRRDARRDRERWERRQDRREYRNERRAYRDGRRDERRWRRAQERREFYRDRRRLERQTRWLHHLNHGWNHQSYRHGHYGRPNAWRYHDRYYTYGYDRRRFAYYDGVCEYRNNDDAAIVGALLGAIIGGAAANDDDVGIGILLGAGFGAALGSSVGNLDNCDRAQYQYAMNYAFEHNEPYYWGSPHSGVRGSVIVRETYVYNDRECRWGDAEIYMPDGTYNYDRVRMCRDAYGDWEVARQQ